MGRWEHFAGDGLMIFFNDPVAMFNHEIQAATMAGRDTRPDGNSEFRMAKARYRTGRRHRTSQRPRHAGPASVLKAASTTPRSAPSRFSRRDSAPPRKRVRSSSISDSMPPPNNPSAQSLQNRSTLKGFVRPVNAWNIVDVADSEPLLSRLHVPTSNVSRKGLAHPQRHLGRSRGRSGVRGQRVIAPVTEETDSRPRVSPAVGTSHPGSAGIR